MIISELFRSIQGESSFAGLPCTFIRTAGCSLRCSYCDTDYALSKKSGVEMELDEVLARVRHLGMDLVELTGGEPLEQEETPELCKRLLREGAKVLIETGGHKRIDVLPAEVIKILDIKTPSSRMAPQNDWHNLNALSPEDEVKFVICNREDFDWSMTVCEEYGLFGRQTILFSPGFETLQYATLAHWILEEKIPVRMQLQIHKFIWSPTARGV
ncbi:MAG: radical SAM protein [bacterium]|jgi:7-carboxy-7-deazaguanine synthase